MKLNVLNALSIDAGDVSFWCAGGVQVPTGGPAKVHGEALPS